MVNTEHIENDAIDFFKMSLKVSDKVTPFINSNDKTPSWDGQIKLSESSSSNKGGIYVPIQVKGTCVNTFGGDTITKSVDVEDLINYRNHHGTLYLVVQLTTRISGKVYYEYLTPADIYKYLKNKEDQKTVTITLKHFDMSTAFKVESIIRTFYFETDLQNSSTIYSDDFSKCDTLHFVTYGPENNFLASLINNEIYAHGEIVEDGIRNNIASRLTFSELVIVEDGEISANSIIFYSSYKRIYDKSSELFQFGSGLKYNATTGKFMFDDIGTLNERILNFEFFFALIEGGELFVNDRIVFNKVVMTGNIDKHKEVHQYLLKAREFFNEFKVSEDFDISQLIPLEQSNFNFLMDLMFFNKVVPMGDNKEGFYLYCFKNNEIIVFMTKDKNDNIQIQNPFNEHFESNILTLVEHDTNKIIDDASVYFMIEEDVMAHAKNIDFDKILKSVYQMKKTDESSAQMNSLGLKLLNVYDKSNRLDALKCAYDVFTYLSDMEIDAHIYILNRFQAIMRTRELEIEEINEVIKMKDVEKGKPDANKSFLWAYSVLLESRAEAKNYWVQLTETEYNELIKYPIYYMYQSLLRN